MVITDDTSVDHKNSIQKGCADYGNYLCNPDHIKDKVKEVLVDLDCPELAE